MNRNTVPALDPIATGCGLALSVLVAIGLVFAIEGILFAALPGPVKRAMAHVTETPDSALRLVGIASAIVGVVLVWLVRG